MNGRSLSVILSVLTLLFGGVAHASQSLSNGIAPKDCTAGAQVDSAQSLNDPAGKEMGLGAGNNGEHLPVLTGASVEERPEAIRRSIRSCDAQGNEETLFEKGREERDISMPIVFNDAVEHYIHYFTTTKREMFKRWLKRKKQYAPIVKGVLKEHGLPEELVYLAMIESGFNVLAYSPMKAAGPWQFIPETGKRYGLEINHWIDERRDIGKSTIAAARYLEELFDQFGCWYLAAAGYNAGENRIERMIRRHGTRDFWELRAYDALPRETQEYVPQLIAAAIIAKDPERYGMGEIQGLPAFEFVKETIPGGVPLEMVARAASVDSPTIRRFNPEIKTAITPPGKEYRIKLPAKTDRIGFRSSLFSMMKEGKRVVGVFRHVADRRDNLPKITRRYGVSRHDLALVNGSPLALKKGVVVYIPRLHDTDEERELISVHTVEHAKRPGRRFVSDSGANGRTVSHRVGRTETDRTLGRVEKPKKGRIGSGRPLLAKHPTKLTPGEAQKRYHIVERGENVSSIAVKYKMTAEALQRLNGLKSDRVHRGAKIRVF